MSVFAGSDEDLRNLAGLLNSRLLRRGLNVLAPTLNYQIGDVSRLPAVTGDGDAERVSELVRLVREEWLDEETAHAFGQNPLLNSESPALSSSATDARGRSNARNMQIAKLEEESEAYWAQQIEDQSGLTAPRKPALEAIAAPKDGASDADLVKDFLSVAVGCMLGRYSLDKPGLILADQGGSLEEYLEKIPNPSFVPDIDGVIPIIDGDWFEDDIVAKFRQFLRVSFGEEHFEENLKFISSTLGVRDLGDYFAKSFYKDHVQRYKKRPIYWLFSSPKGSFSALVYLHRYNSATVSTVLNEYLREFIEKLKASLEHQERLVAGIGSAKEISVSQREADRLRKMLIELTEYERNLYELALKKIDLDLDDGVLVNYRKFGSALRDIGLKKSDPSE
jgi:hypothetical protein